ncbi:hypothetical protein ES702_06182 [subsurface metagenome]
MNPQNFNYFENNSSYRYFSNYSGKDSFSFSLLRNNIENEQKFMADEVLIPASRVIDIELLNSGTGNIVVVDNNTNLRDYEHTSFFTVSSVDRESVNTLSSKRNVCRCSDFFEPTALASELAGEIVAVNFIDSSTKKILASTTLAFEKTFDNHRCIWTFTSSQGFSIKIKDRLLQPNNNENRELADLNLLALMFSFCSALHLPEIQRRKINGSKEKAFRESLDTFKKYKFKKYK